MIKVWLMLMMMHSPDLPTVKYQAILYKTYDECTESLVNYLNMYESKSEDYKSYVKTDAICISFDAFPIKNFNNTGA